MATSGSFETNKYSIRGLRFEWWRTGYSIEGNYSDISWTFKGYGGGTKWYYTKNGYVNINGSRVFTQGDTKVQLSDGTVLASGSTRIYHNADGTKSFGADGGATIYNYGTYQTGSGSWTLDTIPRYADITQFDVSAVNETQIKFTWGASASCDAVQYSVDGGGWTNGVYPTITISGLSAGVQHSVKIRVKRQDSQLWTESGTKYATTYNYPYVSSAPNFTIGNQNTISLYNPLGRKCSVYIINPAGTQMGGDSTTGTSISGYNNDSWKSFFYAGIPSAKSGTYKVRLVVESPARDTTVNGGTYSITGNEVPTFSNFTYADTNNTVTGVTGNNQILVKGLSTPRVTISSANKMVAQKSATPKSYTAVIDTLSKSANYSTSDITMDLGTIANAGTKRLTVTAYDSRTLSKEVYKDVTVMDYAKPVINATVTRLNNFENQTTLKVAGTYTRLTISNVDKNTINSVQYRYRETGGSWSGWVNISTTVNAGKFTCNDVILSLDNTKSFEFEIKATDKLTTNTDIRKVDVGQAVFMISSNKRACYINGQEILQYDVVDTW